MTKLLEQAFSEAAKLPESEQNSVAARWLEDLKDEKLWDKAFSETTDAQWDKLADMVKQDIDGGVSSLEDFLEKLPE